MYKLFIATIFLSCLLSCNAQTKQKDKTNKNKTTKTTTMEEGKDYLLLKRFRIEDKYGFNQPVEASSFLLPANWDVKSNIQWNGRNKCIPEMVQAFMQASSPDGAYELTLFPVTQLDWSDDPVYLDAMRRGFNMHSCTIAAPVNAATYISQYIAPYSKAQVTSTNTIPELQQAMDASAMQMTNVAQSVGNYAYTHKGSAAEGLLKYNDGSEGLALCTVMQTITNTPGTQGGMANTYQCYVSMRMVLKYKAGNEAMARKILNTCLSSTRINPQWANALQRFFAVVTKGAQDATWNQIQISHAAQQEISNNIVRSWEARNSSNTNNNNEANADGFGQYIRGVDSWTDDSGNKVELASGYSNAWGTADGNYIVSDSHGFDPNVELNGTQKWSRLKK
jgi:hypothetical protein